METTVIAGMAYVAMQPEEVSPLIGASGCVAGMMGVCCTWWPRGTVRERSLAATRCNTPPSCRQRTLRHQSVD